MLKKIKQYLSNTYISRKIKLYKKINKLHKKKENKKIKRHTYQIKLKLKNRKINLKKIVFPLLFIIILITIFIIKGPLFKITKIEILRQDPRSNISIAYMAIGNLKGKSIFNIDKKKLEEKLKNYQNNINYIKITKHYPSTIQIKIGSYDEIFNTIINNKQFLVLQNGTLIPINKINPELKNIEIKNEKLEKFIDYKQILKQKYLEKISYINRKLEKNLLTNSISNIDYFPIEREVHFIFKNKVRTIFDINTNKELIDYQIKKLLIFDKQKMKLNKTLIIYIDLRINNKLYYCLTENEYKCKLNLKRIYGL